MTADQKPNLPGPARILMIRPSALGDVCRTAPALVSLRRAFPQATIDWVVQDTFVDAVRAHPDLNEVIPFPRARFSRFWRSMRIAGEVRQWARDIRAREYDLVFDLQGLGRSGWIARATRAPRRVGYRSAREGAWLGYTVRHDPPRATHAVDQMLELLEREGIEAVRDMRLYVPADADEKWNERVSSLEINRARYALLAPTSRWASKRWPIGKWGELIDPLRRRGYENIVIIGGPGEREQIAPLLERAPDACIDLVAKTSVGETMAAVRDAALVIANDSAPLHVAVGFDRPLIGIFGPTNPEFVGPYGRDDSVVRPQVSAGESHVNYRDTDDALIATIEVDAVVSRMPCHGTTR